MYLRLGMCMALIVAAFVSKAQQDTILLKPVTVYGLPEEKYLVGSQLFQLDSTLQYQQNSRALGEILSFQFPIYFRTYGNGMISGISMRGTSPQHVAVLWNGININSYSLGQADFSILPTVAFDEVKVHVGGGSARFGSGAFGGSVLLSMAVNNTPLLSISQEAGSFGRYFTSIKNSFDVGKLSSASSFYHVQSRNDFTVPGSDDRQSHAAYLQQGFVQSLQYNFSGAKKLRLNYWYHNADREIQPTIGNTNSTDEQADQNHRLSLSYEQNNSKGHLKLGGGIVDDKIIYNGIKSEIFRWISSASHQYTFVNRLNVSFNAEWNHIVGKIEEYGPEEPVEDRVDIAGSLQKEYKKISWSINLRQPFITQVKAPILPYIGMDAVLFEHPTQKLLLKVNGSKNFRAPTLNDRYWQDAGREDLQPETSYASEIGLQWSFNKLKINSSGFYQNINEWIQWVPGANGVYRPQNVKEVRITGIETSAEMEQTYGLVSLRGKVAYQYIRSITLQTHDADQAAIGKQLIYTPVHESSATVGASYKTWATNFFLQYSGKRYTESSNSPIYALDPFALVDFSISKSWKHKRHSADFYLIVKNLFDTNYQLYSGRAMPGRNFNFKISYHLNHNK